VKKEEPKPEPEPEVKVNPEIMEPMLAMGYSERAIHLAAQLRPFPSQMETDADHMLFYEIVESDVLSVPLPELEERVARKRGVVPVVEKRDTQQPLGQDEAVSMHKLEGLAALTMVLRALHLKETLPPSFVDHCKAENLHAHVLKTWDDTDYSSGKTRIRRVGAVTQGLESHRAVVQPWTADLQLTRRVRPRQG
jgi:hypothetical protein